MYSLLLLSYLINSLTSLCASKPLDIIFDERGYLISVMFVQAVVEEDPEYVVRRFESGRYSIDSECRRIYQRAMDLVEVGISRVYTYMYSQH